MINPAEETNEDILERLAGDRAELITIETILEEWLKDNPKAIKKWKKDVKNHLKFIDSGIEYLNSIEEKIYDFEEKAEERKPCVITVDTDEETIQ